MQVWALIVDCFRDALDRKLFWVMLAISAVIAGAMACIGFSDDGVSVLFGAWSYETSDYAQGNELGRATIGSILVYWIGDLYIGWIAIILALIGTADIFPSLVERGAIDVVLGKPMSRFKVFLGKYAGGMVFVALQATVFVLLTFLVVGLRWNQWFPGYLWSIPLIVVLFSYVYAFCALFGIVTRSVMTSLLLAIVAWMVIWIPQKAYAELLSVQAVYAAQADQSEQAAAAGIDEKWVRGVGAVRWVLPKTQDIPLIAGNQIDAGTFSEVLGALMGTEAQAELGAALEAEAKAEDKLADISIVKSIGSSLLFEAVIVLLALWRFSRQDF
jgi:ABC-type transport system involved in multi-copper enzyme maturation permease subunit